MNTITWLHISDLHLQLPRTPEPEPDLLPYDVNVVLRSFLDDVTERIERDDLQPDFIAVTGDVAFSGKAAEYALARRFFDDLLARTGLGKDRLFLVPGNHDADRARFSRGARGIAASLTDRSSINEVLAEAESCDLLFARFGAYTEFIRDYLGGEALPDERGIYVRMLDVGGQQVALLGLNSAWLAQGGGGDYGKLAVGERLVRAALDRAVGADLALALLHHPFAWLQEFEQGDSQALLCRECDFILHGHLHATGLTFQRDPDTEATVLGAGALYKAREYPNGYNLVQLDLAAHRGRCVFRTWSDRRGGFWTADTQTYRNVENGVYTFPYGAAPPPLSEPEPPPPAPAATVEVRWLPVPPEPHFAHPYPLQENFTGRVREREALTRWWSGGRRPVLAVVALGGMGKSALTWAWLQRDVLGQALPGQVDDPPGVAARCRVDETQRPEGVLWWSFYEQEAKFAAFLAEALQYASDGRIPPAALPSPHERLRWLLYLLQQRRLLLVLDGFERELRAYASLSAAYQGNHVDEDRQDLYRTCIDPFAAAFLRAVAALPLRGQVLITSRLFPRELDGMAGCRYWDLRRLDPDDAVAFFQAQGVRGTRAEIQAACQPYGYHPLALRLLAGLIARAPARPGDAAVAAEYDVVGELVHHILTLAYDALRPELQELLSRLAAFRAPVAYDVLEVLSPIKGKRELGRAMRELEDRGLLFRDREAAGAARYDLHPVVRGYAYDRLADKAGVHGQLHDYFEAVPQAEKVERVEDLAPVIELYHHTVRAGRYDEAFALYGGRLGPDPLYFRFGAYQTCIELLRALFPDGEDQLPRLKDEADQAWTLNELAISYSLSGQPRRAVPLYEMHNALREKADSKKNLAIVLGNLAGYGQVPIGELAAAERNLWHEVEFGRSSGERYPGWLGTSELGHLLALEARFDEASDILDEADEYARSAHMDQWRCVNMAYRAQRALLLGDDMAALEAARRARELADVQGYERGIIRAKWLLGWTLIARARPNEAEPHLTEALSRCRRINMVDHEADILLAWAHWHLAKGNREEAHQHAAEALAIAERCEYRLAQADIHNFLARWHMEGGNTQDARHHAEIAQERARCDGPPHCCQPALDEAERLLAELAEGA